MLWKIRHKTKKSNWWCSFFQESTVVSTKKQNEVGARYAFRRDLVELTASRSRARVRVRVRLRVRAHRRYEKSSSTPFNRRHTTRRQRQWRWRPAFPTRLMLPWHYFLFLFLFLFLFYFALLFLLFCFAFSNATRHGTVTSCRDTLSESVYMYFFLWISCFIGREDGHGMVRSTCTRIRNYGWMGEFASKQWC